MPNAVGIIPNPQSGKDARRIVADATVMNNHDKVGIVRRTLRALAKFGVGKALIMPDEFGIGLRAMDSYGIDIEILDMEISGAAEDSRRAARMMDGQVACIVTIGGDGTNRAVAGGCGETPLVPISTGTNNVFPTHVDGTIAGMAASALALGLVEPSEVCWRSKRILVSVEGLQDLALVDAAVTSEPFAGARAIWNIDTVKFLLAAQAQPYNLGLSSVAGILDPTGRQDPWGVFVELDKSGLPLLAPLAPGLLQQAKVKGWQRVPLGFRWAWLASHSGTVALDGERELAFVPGQRILLQLDRMGPLVVDPFLTVLKMAASGRMSFS
jgi:predicted polyphosphate/ATP-dependent NAD kinase